MTRLRTSLQAFAWRRRLWPSAHPASFDEVFTAALGPEPDDQDRVSLSVAAIALHRAHDARARADEFNHDTRA